MHTLELSCSPRLVNLIFSQLREYNRRGGRKNVGNVMNGQSTKGMCRQRGWGNRDPINMGKSIPVGTNELGSCPSTSTIRMKEGWGICGNVSELPR